MLINILVCRNTYPCVMLLICVWVLTLVHPCDSGVSHCLNIFSYWSVRYLGLSKLTTIDQMCSLSSFPGQRSDRNHWNDLWPLPCTRYDIEGWIWLWQYDPSHCRHHAWTLKTEVVCLGCRSCQERAWSQYARPTSTFLWIQSARLIPCEYGSTWEKPTKSRKEISNTACCSHKMFKTQKSDL